jgi:D-inositol-3-phosphate glycosyltransferase
MYRAPHDSLKILPPGVDHDMFRPGDRSEARKRLRLPSNRPLLLFVGRIQPLKGCDLAIRSLAELPGPFSNAELLVVGGPSGAHGEDELEKLHKLVDELGLESRVHFLGPKPHAELPDHYRAADVVLVCSHSESFALAPLEAQASGRPVIGTPVGGLSHLVREGRSGFLIHDRDPEAFAERLTRILGNADLAASFEKRAYLESLPFSWTATADQILDLYDCLVSDRFPELCTC